MKRSVFDFRIPTPVGLLLLIIAVLTTVYSTQSSTFVNLRANLSANPAFVRTSNITDNSITVSYTTAATTTGTITFGESEASTQVIMDDKDKASGKPAEYQIHYFTISSLKPSTQYIFKIISGTSTFDNNGTPYTVITAPVISTPTNNQRIIQGNIILPNGSYPKQAIAQLQISNAQLLTTKVLQNGTYKFNLSNLRSQNLTQYQLLTDSDKVTLTFIGDGNQATAETTLKDAIQVPVVTLTNQYTFTAEQPASLTASGSGDQKLPEVITEEDITGFVILVPQKNQEFTDSQPEFSGKALPNKNVDVLISAETDIQAAVKADTNGNWKYRPSKKLDPGIHTITVSSPNEENKIEAISESFIIYAEGSQFTEPSVEPTEKPTPIPTIATASATPIITKTASPSATGTAPTIAPTLSPTLAVTPTIINVTTGISPQPSVAAPGSNEVVIALGLIAFATIASIMLFFLIQV